MQRAADLLTGLKKKYEQVEDFLDTHYLQYSFLLLLFNAITIAVVIQRVPYTEIDWQAYMQEVSGVINDRQLDYLKLRGDTGPLVYPAGFVYIYSVLYWITDNGRDVRRAQWIFAGVYLSVTAVVLAIYREVCGKSRNCKCPVWVVGLLVVSRRVMSLFVLRMFNDAIEALFMYTAVWMFVRNCWGWGCMWFSLAVSVKMNALLYAPAVMVLLCQAMGIWKASWYVISICGGSQVLSGLPFLLTYPKSYMGRAFELSRIFEYKWSVNGAFLREKFFLNQKLAVGLLMLHLFLLLIFGQCRWTSRGLFKMLGISKHKGRSWWTSLTVGKTMKIRPEHIVSTLFSCNLIGIACARTLHYQFYLWYFHTLPFVLWASRMPIIIRLSILLCIEYVFNVYPPRPEASLALHLCHVLMLNDLWERRSPTDHYIFPGREAEATAKGGVKTREKKS